MKFSNPVEKYYNDNRYQFRNIKTDDNKDVIVKIEPSQIKITLDFYFNDNSSYKTTETLNESNQWKKSN